MDEPRSADQAMDVITGYLGQPVLSASSLRGRRFGEKQAEGGINTMKRRKAFYILLAINVAFVLLAALISAAEGGVFVAFLTLCVTGTWVALLVMIADSLPPRPDA